MMPVEEKANLRDAIEARLRQVIDPETGADVMRMQLVDGLMIDKRGCASYTFRPSSPLCPLAVFLATQIKDAVAEVPGVRSQKIRVEGYIAAEHLTKLMNEES
jgi:metal-sulfur cluster biosynthetic enzyme